MNDLLVGFESKCIAEHRASLADLEINLKDNFDHIELEPEHYFADGLYARELFIPAGTTIVGKIHKTSYLNVLLKGKITISTDNGPETLEAPAIMVGSPNDKKGGYAHTDCVWLNIHGTKETDLEKIENEVITKDYLAIDEGLL